MSEHARSIRVGIAAILLAVIFRLGASPLPDRAAAWLRESNIAAFAIYLETGQHVRFSSPQGLDWVFPPESAPAAALEAKRELPFFDDASALELRMLALREVDIPRLLRRELCWDLTDPAAAVLILHTHATESYSPAAEDYPQSSPWRTLEEDYNMVSIGARVAALLEEAGIRVIHDRQLHDYPSYNGSYAASREKALELLAQEPGIALILDLHRDAADAPGGQLRTLCTMDGAEMAQLMPVVGAGCESWEENLSLGLKLMAQLESQVPGITRPLLLAKSVFNQDLGPRSLLIEVGAAGNSRQEALLAAEELARAIIALAQGTAAEQT